MEQGQKNDVLRPFGLVHFVFTLFCNSFIRRFLTVILHHQCKTKELMTPTESESYWILLRLVCCWFFFLFVSFCGVNEVVIMLLCLGFAVTMVTSHVCLCAYTKGCITAAYRECKKFDSSAWAAYVFSSKFQWRTRLRVRTTWSRSNNTRLCQPFW